MKLELKHLAPYLPYGLKVITTIRSGETLKETLIAISSEGELFTGFQPWVNYADIKPILRPLSDLTKEYINDHEVSFIEHIYSESWMAGGYNARNVGYGYVLESNEDMSTIKISTLKPHTNMWWVTQELIKWHFDVFGLIKKGLAIDINTL